MKKLSSFWLTSILLSIVLCSWLLFPYLTWDSNDFVNAVPLFILILQIILTIWFKNKKLFWLLLFNAAASLVLFNAIRASLNYVIGKPTLIETCCCAGWVAPPAFDEKKLVYMSFFDDDCGDWAGCYYYTLDINNGITKGLIKLFGNPITHALENG
jgi:hypothetical protein